MIARFRPCDAEPIENLQEPQPIGNVLMELLARRGITLPSDSAPARLPMANAKPAPRLMAASANVIGRQAS